MIKISIFPILVALSLIGCVDDGERAKKEWMERHREKFVRSLKDPDSAKFRDEFFGANALCGEVNSKNSMGGYTGFQRFIVTPELMAIEGEEIRSLGEGDNEYDLHKAIDARIVVLEAHRARIESSGKPPSTDELNRAGFAAVWDKFCFSGRKEK